MGFPLILKRGYWIFDLDGTLTIPKHDFAAIREELGIPQEYDILGFLDSLPEHEALPLHQKLAEIEEKVAKETEPAFEVEKLMKLLSQRNIQLGILTRNSKRNAIFSLEAIGIYDYFSEDCILGRDEALPKPHPEGIEKLISCWNVSAQEIIMLGDFLYDLQAGKAAGVATIHVDATKEFSWPAFMDLGIEDLGELVQYLSRE